MDQERRYYFTSFIGLLSLGSLGMFLKHQYEISRTKRQLKRARKAEQYIPSDLIAQIKDDLASQKSKFKKSGANKEIVNLSGFLEGYVKSNGQTIQIGKGSSKQDLIYQVKYITEIFSQDKVNSKRVSYQTQNFPDNAIVERVNSFLLQDKAGTRVEVNFDPSVVHGTVLQLIQNKETLEETNFFQRIIDSLISFLFVVVNGIYRQAIGYELRGIHLGVKETTVGIRVDTPLACYGEIIYDLRDGTLKFQTLQAIVNSKQQFLKSLQDKIKHHSIPRNFFLLVSLLCGVYLSRRAFLYYQKLKKQSQQSDPNLIAPNGAN